MSKQKLIIYQAGIVTSLQKKTFVGETFALSCMEIHEKVSHLKSRLDFKWFLHAKM